MKRNPRASKIQVARIVNDVDILDCLVTKPAPKDLTAEHTLDQVEFV